MCPDYLVRSGCKNVVWKSYPGSSVEEPGYEASLETRLKVYRFMHIKLYINKVMNIN